MTPDTVICAECALTFDLPAVAQCKYCGSRQVRRITHADVIRQLVKDAIDAGDMEGAACLQRALDRWENPAPSVMAQAFDVLAVRR